MLLYQSLSPYLLELFQRVSGMSKQATNSMRCAFFTFVRAINSIAECIFDQVRYVVTSSLLGYSKSALVPVITSKLIYRFYTVTVTNHSPIC